MIEEDYVSFEVAKLLKEKGFDCLCHSYFRKDNPNNLVKETCGTNWNDTPFFTSRPTLQMAMKWLREKHNIVVEPFIREDTKYVWYIHRIETKFNKKYLVFCWGSKNNKYERYEEACEAAIKYCLENLI